VSLATPAKLRRLQEALYTKAKQDLAYRFYLLHDKVYRADILAHAYALAKQKGGAPGVDGETFEDIEAAGRERWLAAVEEAVRTDTYRPQPIRRVVIPKPGGSGERLPFWATPLGRCSTGRMGTGTWAPRPPRRRSNGSRDASGRFSVRNSGAWVEVKEELNRTVRGWANYFSYGTRSRAYLAVDRYVAERVRHFLGRRQQIPSRGTRRYPAERIFGELGGHPVAAP
jgi:hypothetical protein